MLSRLTRRLTILAAVMALCLAVEGPLNAWALSIAEEEKLSRKVMVYLRRAVVPDLVLNGYLEELGQALAGRLLTMPFKPSFYVSDEKELNAFAAPGAVIVVTLGMCGLVESVDELASVLGHELTHAYGRHIAQRSEMAGKVGWAALAVALAGVVASALAGDARIGSAAVMGSGAAGTSLMLSYSRDQELEADQLGSKMMIQAGYDLAGNLSLIEKVRFASTMAGPNPPPYLSTHPALLDRLAFIQNVRSPQPPRQDRAGRSEFPWFKARIEARTRDEEFFRGKDDPISRYALGLVQLRTGKQQAAVESLGQVHREHPDALGVRVSYAEALRLSHRTEEAVPILRQALARRPGDRAALSLLGQTYLDLDMAQEAMGIFEELVRVKADDPDAWHYLGIASGKMNKLAEAHLALATAYSLVGITDKALRNFDLAAQNARNQVQKDEIQKKRKDALEYLPENRPMPR